jgi:hypothetical protein
MSFIYYKNCIIGNLNEHEKNKLAYLMTNISYDLYNIYENGKYRIGTEIDKDNIIKIIIGLYICNKNIDNCINFIKNKYQNIPIEIEIIKKSNI